MDPVTLLAWLGIILVGLVILFYFVAPLVIALAVLVYEVGKDYRADWHLRRAHKGKVKCEWRQWRQGDKRCSEIAVRQTPQGVFCEDHWHRRSGFGAVSYAHMLDHARVARDDS